MKSVEKRVLCHLRSRGWDRVRPADIAKSIMIEGAELLELFQWENLPLEDVKRDAARLKEIEAELADVMIYCLDMAVLLDLDTKKIILNKLALCARKYPAALMRKDHRREKGTESAYSRIKKEHRRNKGLLAKKANRR